MRIDQLLNCLCLVKSRSAAARLCAGGSVQLDGQPGKPSARVRVGDQLTIRFASRSLTIEIVAIPSGRVSRVRAPEFYRVLEARSTDALDDDPGESL